jgi:hypothetical protein
MRTGMGSVQRLGPRQRPSITEQAEHLVKREEIWTALSNGNAVPLPSAMPNVRTIQTCAGVAFAGAGILRNCGNSIAAYTYIFKA